MHILSPFSRAALAIALAASSLGTAHATLPGENGVIVFSRKAVVGAAGIWRVNADGKTRLMELDTGGTSPAVSPDGTKIAYVVGSATGHNSIIVMGIDGSNKTTVFTGGLDMAFPAWSPDGSRLAVHDMIDSSYAGIRILETSTWTTVGAIRTTGSVVSVNWSPLGIDIVAGTAGRAGYRYNANTGAWSTLANGLYYASYFPSGDKLVGAIGENPNTACTYTMTVAGKDLKQLSCSGEWAAISPDGKQYVISNFEDGDADIGTLDGSAPEFHTFSGIRHVWSRVPIQAMSTTLAGGNWSAPSTLPGDSGTYTGPSAIARMPGGGVLRRAVAVRSDGRLYERAQGLNNAWNNWTLVPGLVGKTADGVRAKHVAIAGALDGSVQAAIVGQDDLVYHAKRNADGTWSGFTALNGANGAPNFAARDVSIAVTRNEGLKPGTTHIVANGLLEGQVYHRVRWADGSWTPWAIVSNEPAQTSSVAIATADNDDAYLLTSSPTQGLMRKVRFGKDGSWSDWVVMSNQPQGVVKDVALAVRGYGVSNSEAHVSYVDAQSKVWYRAVPSPRDVPYWTNPAFQPTEVMGNGRTVSVSYDANISVELLAGQAQPQ